MNSRLLNILIPLIFFCCSQSDHINQVDDAFADNGRYETKYFTTSDGIKLRYLTSGTGPTLVLQPGWMMPAELFTPQLEQLTNSFRVIAMDPRGQGLSEDAPDGNSVDRRVKDIYELIEHEKIDSLILGGWSLGVIEILHYVEMYGTNKLSGLVLIDGPITTDDQEIVQPGWKSLVNNLQTNRTEFEDSFMSALFKKEPDSAFYTLIENRLSNTPTNSSFVAMATHIVNPRDYSQILNNADVPTLVTLAIWSFQLEKYEQISREIKIESFECGHALFVDEPERFNRLIKELYLNGR